MRLVVGPENRLAAALDLAGPADLIALCSPGGQGPPLEDPRIARRVLLTFNDIAAARDGLVAPDATTIADLLAFADGAAVVVIYCFAGVSRSTAAAYALACQAAGPGAEASLAAQLRDLSAAATPNPLMVALADAALGREGRMVRAIAGIGRGGEAFEGPLFDWRVAPRGVDPRAGRL